MSERLTTFEARLVDDFLAENWGEFLVFLDERDATEREADQISDKLGVMADAGED